MTGFKFVPEVKGARPGGVVLQDALLDTGGGGVEGQVHVAGMAGHALVEHDVGDFAELAEGGIALRRFGNAPRGSGPEGRDGQERGGEQYGFLHFLFL